MSKILSSKRKHASSQPVQRRGTDVFTFTPAQDEAYHGSLLTLSESDHHSGARVVAQVMPGWRVRTGHPEKESYATIMPALLKSFLKREAGGRCSMRCTRTAFTFTGRHAKVHLWYAYPRSDREFMICNSHHGTMARADDLSAKLGLFSHGGLCPILIPIIAGPRGT